MHPLGFGVRAVAVRALAACAFAGLLLAGSAALAQVPANCDEVRLEDPPRMAFECAGGLLIEVEAAAEMGFVAPGAGEPVTGLELRGGAARIDVEPAGRGLQIRTPHAIAAVRGTQYFVDAGAETTSVFVVRGEVEVRKVEGSEASVLLRDGDGVDVTLDGELVVKRWRPERVQALLARFGR